jgi:uncharacterized protein YndB with AHSA1/START domain
MNTPQQTMFRVRIRASLEAVWRELTKQGEPQAAIFNAWLTAQALTPGSMLQMRTGSGRHTLVIGRVTDFTPPHRFAHTFRFTQYDDPECEVIYELKDLGGEVECTLTLINLPMGTKTAKDMSSGGQVIVNTLKTLLETGCPAFGTRVLYWLFAHMEFVLPKRTRSEHWPMK